MTAWTTLSSAGLIAGPEGPCLTEVMPVFTPELRLPRSHHFPLPTVERYSELCPQGFWALPKELSVPLRPPQAPPGERSQASSKWQVN